MNITYTIGEPLEFRTRRAATITIALTPDDDPDGHTVGLLVRGRLEAFPPYPRPGDAYAGCSDQEGPLRPPGSRSSRRCARPGSKACNSPPATSGAWDGEPSRRPLRVRGDGQGPDPQCPRPVRQRGRMVRP